MFFGKSISAPALPATQNASSANAHGSTIHLRMSPPFQPSAVSAAGYAGQTAMSSANRAASSSASECPSVAAAAQPVHGLPHGDDADEDQTDDQHPGDDLLALRRG